MGDRTSVTLQVLKIQAAVTENIITESGNDCDEHYQDEKFTYYSFYEVNYGALGFLTQLKEAGIPFDSSWDHGSEYGPGTEYLRFLPDGSTWQAEISDSFVNPNLKKCMELIDKSDELREFIKKHHELVSPPSWDSQEEYAKLFLTKQLINPQ